MSIECKVCDPQEFEDEAGLLRRAFGWDTPIIAREWLDIAVAGTWMFGDAAQEVRTWVVDGEPVAWGLHAVPDPVGFPPTPSELNLIRDMARKVAMPFASRLIVADFARTTDGSWQFIEGGPGAAAGTAHENVFKFVACRLVDREYHLVDNAVGGRL